MALFDPDCNAHRELTAWFEEDVSAAVPHSRDRGRKDYNFRSARYQPNKQVNLDTILKKWKSLFDEDLSFAGFHGKYIKLIKEMELIGQPPTEAKRYEMLRGIVKNPNLSHIVVNLSLPESRKNSL